MIEAEERAGLLADPAEVRAILVASAKAGQWISYSEVLGLLGHHFTRPKMRQLCKVLSYVDDEAAARGEPELAVLVVRASDGLPGQGWWVGGAKKHGYTGLWEGPKAARLIRKVQKQAFDYWSDSPPLGEVAAPSADGGAAPSTTSHGRLRRPSLAYNMPPACCALRSPLPRWGRTC